MSQFIVEVVEQPADRSVVLAPELTEAARKFAAESKAENTRKAYRSDWRLFKAWCDAQGGAALPAEPSHTAAYLADLAGSARVSTVMRRAASIASGHRAAGHLSPVSSEVVKAVLRGIRRSKGVAQQGKRPTLTGDIKALVRAMGDGLLDKRDAALLLVGFGAALRRSELVWLDVADVQFRDEGALLTLRRSKTDQTGQGKSVAVLRRYVRHASLFTDPSAAHLGL